MTRELIEFLHMDTVLRLHEIAIADQGGDPSIRDRGLLESAVAMPQQQFAGEYLHPTIPAMAGAYAFHIAKNHPFVDGNKRAAFSAMIAFLTLNAWKLDADPLDAERTIVGLAAGEIDKDSLISWVMKNSHQKPSLELRQFFQAASRKPLREKTASPEAVPGSAEFDVCLRDAEHAIPLLKEIRADAEAHRLNGDSQALARCAAETALLMQFFRLAQDMGYEW